VSRTSFDRVVPITGAGSGIGAALATRIARRLGALDADTFSETFATMPGAFAALVRRAPAALETSQPLRHRLATLPGRPTSPR